MLKDIIKNIKNEVNFQLDNINEENIIDISKKIENCTGNIYLTGIGKSENIAKHCCSLLKCINIKAFYLHIKVQIEIIITNHMNLVVKLKKKMPQSFGMFTKKPWYSLL